jgi:serine protease Do
MRNNHLHHKPIVCALALLFAVSAAFSQASVLRDYVGIIEGTYHPDALAYFDKMKDTYKKRGKSDTVKAIDDYIKMGFGTGFVYVAPDGVNYVITNYHVVSQTNTLAISFEKLDGAKTTYNRLSVVAADEDIDIAILSFADGAKPFSAGLSFVTSPAEEGSDAYAAGFPGMFNEQIWQFSRGVISNARMRWPHDIEDEEGVNPARWGPFIQHTSSIDHGNSGGPLLVQQAGVTSGYAVAGINARGLSGYRENTFFAIPADRALAYITEAVKPKDEAAMRQNLDVRLDAFVKGIAKPRAVYATIADYLSNACTASNAEYAIGETFSRAPRTVQEAIDNVYDPIDTMKYCVAWLIEDSFRGKTSGTLRATPGDITRNTDGSYTVPLQFSGDRVINTTWTLEFGMWKLDKAGDLVSGDKTLVEKQKTQRERDRQKTDYENFVMLSLGYNQIFDHKVGEKRSSAGSFGDTIKPITAAAPALDISVFVVASKYWLYEGSLTIADKFWQADMKIGGNVPFDINMVTLAPYAVVGANIHKYNNERFDEQNRMIQVGALIQGGLMVSTSAVRGLYFVAGYQYNVSLLSLFSDTAAADTKMLKFNLGYAFSL